jgi:hypothetical protein
MVEIVVAILVFLALIGILFDIDWSKERINDGNKFEDDLRYLLNVHSAENRSNTPDFILAEYMLACLNVFDDTVNKREQWYSRDKESESE